MLNAKIANVGSRRMSSVAILLLALYGNIDLYRKRTGNVKKLSGDTCRKYKGLRALW
jgi:hypothetical protein